MLKDLHLTTNQYNLGQVRSGFSCIVMQYIRAYLRLTACVAPPILDFLLIFAGFHLSSLFNVPSLLPRPLDTVLCLIFGRGASESAQ
jgi:hypothetical protein